MLTILFTKTPNTGALKGHTIPDQRVTFPSEFSAMLWVAGVRSNPTISDVRLAS